MNKKNKTKIGPIMRQLTDLGKILLAVLFALILGGLFLLLLDVRPMEVYKVILLQAIGNFDSVLRRAMPLMLTGLAVSIPMKTGMLNIGGEGQLAAGALTAAIIGSLELGLPKGIHALVAMLAAIVVGVLLAGLPALLSVKRGTSEVVTTIMLNSILSYIVTWLVMNPFRGSEYSPETSKVLETARIPGFQGVDFSWGLIVAISLCVGTWVFLERSPKGLAMKSVGLNPLAACYQGIDTRVVGLLGMALGGGMASIGGALEALGGAFSYSDGYFLLYGYDGIAIAFMARNNPLAIVVTSIIIAAIRIGSLAISRKAGISTYFNNVLQGLMITLMVSPAFSDLLFRWIKHVFGRSRCKDRVMT